MHYIDKEAFHPMALIALGVDGYSSDIPDLPAAGDVIYTSPFNAHKWSWLPKFVLVKTLPDDTEVPRMTPLEWKLKQEFPSNTTYKKAPPTQRSPNYTRYVECVQWATSHTYGDRISIGEADYEYSIVTDPDEALDVLRTVDRDWFGFDYEYDPNQVIIGLGLANKAHSWYLEGDGLRAAMGHIPTLLMSPKKVAHYAKAEYKVTDLNTLGRVKPTDYPPFYDTNTTSWVLTSRVGGHDLKGLTEQHLKRTVLRFDDVAPDGDLRNTPPELRARYASADPRNTLDLLLGVFKPELEKEGLWRVYDEIERPLTPVLVEMEMPGLHINRKRLGEMVDHYSRLAKNYAGALKALGYKEEITPDKIAHWFFDELGLPVFAKTQKRPSVADPVLNRLRPYHPAIEVYQAYQESTKFLSTFLLPVWTSGDDRISYSLSQTSTRTGRLSCTAAAGDPEKGDEKGEGTNMQNWPLIVREIIEPEDTDEYEFVSADYSAVEPRIAATDAPEPRMLADFMAGVNPYISLGGDLGFDPVKVADKSSHAYKVAKTTFLAWLYGGSGFKMAEICARDGVHLTPEECDSYASRLRSSRPALVAWRERILQQTRATGGSRTMFGRRRLIPQIYSPDPSMRLEAERWAINVVPQGTSADLIKLAMATVSGLSRGIGRHARLAMQVHDELDFILPKGFDTYEIEKGMTETGRELGIPLAVSVARGANWMEAHA